MALTPANFAAFFCAIHGHDPFPWQQRLVEHLASNNRWPDVLDLPTGSGKTAALDVAVFHLALQANCPRRRAALRIVLLVDRSLVVDDAGRRAQRIAAALCDPSRCPEAGRGLVAEVAWRLQRLAGSDEAPLVAEPLVSDAAVRERNRVKEAEPTPLCLMWLSVVPREASFSRCSGGNEHALRAADPTTLSTKQTTQHGAKSLEDKTRRSIAYLLIALLAFLVIALLAMVVFGVITVGTLWTNWLKRAMPDVGAQ